MTTQRVSDYERWPDGGKRPTVYALLMLAKIYRVDVGRLLDERDYAALNEKQLFEIIELCRKHTVTEIAQQQDVDDTDRQPAAAVKENSATNRRKVLHVFGATTASLSMPADLESIELSRRAEETDLGSRTLEHLQLGIDRIGQEYLRTPLPKVLKEVRSYRQYVGQLLKGRHTLAEQVRLYNLAAQLSALLAHLSFDLGEHGTTIDAHSDAALRLAKQVDQRELTAWIRGTQAMTATYQGRPKQAKDFAQAGLSVAPQGSAVTVRLLAQEARARARLGDRAGAENAMARAERAYEGLSEEPTTSIFSFAHPYLPFYTGTCYIWLKRPKRAEQYAREAVQLCDVSPSEWPVARIFSRIDLASALMQQNEPEGAMHLAVEVLKICTVGRLMDLMADRLAELIENLKMQCGASVVLELEEHFRSVFAARRKGV